MDRARVSASPQKPSYLGLLNAIANAEGLAHRYFSALSETARDPDLKALARLVAVREGEHSLTFEKRMIDLGFSLRERPDPTFEKTLALMSDASVDDLAKLEHLGYGDGGALVEGPDPFGEFFADRTIDIETGGLLGRYIAEERDTLRRMRAMFLDLRARSAKRRRGKAA